MERDGTDVHGRAYATACALVADKLVQRTAVDVSGPVVGVSVFRNGAGVRGAAAGIVRRDFMKGVAAVGAAATVSGLPQVASAATELDDRAYWLHLLTKICGPVLRALSERKLKATMPVEVPEGSLAERKPFAYLAALANVLAGIAPWLETGPRDGPEGALREQYADWARKAILAGTDPTSPDFMDFNEGKPAGGGRGAADAGDCARSS